MKNEENWCQDYLTDGNLMDFLERCDKDLAEECSRAGCVHCGSKLHRADFERKPRGGVQGEGVVWRFSFCCSREGCRKRHTPASVRFLGRKVYLGFVVILVSAMRHGLSAERVRELRERFSIDRRTLERWRKWWLENFAQSGFWKAARARFMPPLCESALPLSLCEAFQIGCCRRERLLDLLRFLSPLTGSWLPATQGF